MITSSKNKKGAPQPTDASDRRKQVSLYSPFASTTTPTSRKINLDRRGAGTGARVSPFRHGGDREGQEAMNNQFPSKRGHRPLSIEERTSTTLHQLEVNHYRSRRGKKMYQSIRGHRSFSVTERASTILYQREGVNHSLSNRGHQPSSIKREVITRYPYTTINTLPPALSPSTASSMLATHAIATITRIELIFPHVREIH